VKVLQMPDIKDIWASQGADVGGMPPAEFEAFVHSEIVKWAKVVKEANLKVDL
jgi:tripartite-type tricarboxylate transporter receptor subunit TctC